MAVELARRAIFFKRRDIVVKLARAFVKFWQAWNVTNVRPSSSQAKKDHTMHYILKFADRFDVQVQHADELRYALCYANACYVGTCCVNTHPVNKFAYAPCCKNEFEIGFLRVPSIDEKELISIPIIADNINFRFSPKRKKMDVRPRRLHAIYHIVCSRKDPHNTWIARKHKWRSRIVRGSMSSRTNSFEENGTDVGQVPHTP